MHKADQDSLYDPSSGILGVDFGADACGPDLRKEFVRDALGTNEQETDLLFELYDIVQTARGVISLKGELSQKELFNEFSDALCPPTPYQFGPPFAFNPDEVRFLPDKVVKSIHWFRLSVLLWLSAFDRERIQRDRDDAARFRDLVNSKTDLNPPGMNNHFNEFQRSMDDIRRSLDGVRQNNERREMIDRMKEDAANNPRLGDFPSSDRTRSWA